MVTGNSMTRHRRHDIAARGSMAAIARVALSTYQRAAAIAPISSALA